MNNWSKALGDPLEKKAPKTSNSQSPTQPFSQASKSLSNPFGDSGKKSETTKTEPIKTEKKPEEPKKENKLHTKLFEEEKPVEKPATKPSLVDDILSTAKKVITFAEPKKVEKKDKEMNSSDGPLILFGSSKNEKKENPFVAKSSETKTISVK